MINKIFDEETLKKVKNRPYWEMEEKAILAFFEHHGIEVNEIKMGVYEDDPGCLIHNEFANELPLDETEPAGYFLEMVILQEWETPPDWVYELMHRIAWGLWPKGFQHPDYCGDMDYTAEFGAKLKYRNCWHHRSIKWHRMFCQEPAIWLRLEMGLCYCS
jgi:hypothetical protein